MDPLEQWAEGLEKKVSAGMSLADATRQLVKTNPKLHAEYLEAYNAADTQTQADHGRRVDALRRRPVNR